MTLVIRRARSEDARAVAELAVALVEQHVAMNAERFQKLYGADQAIGFYAGRAESDDAAVLVAEIENEIVGMAYIEFTEKAYEEMTTRAAWLHDIIVKPEWRHHGIGPKLLESAAETAKALGADKLLLTVAAENGVAEKVFMKHGFRPTMTEMMLDLK